MRRPYLEVWKLAGAFRAPADALWPRLETDARLLDHARYVWGPFDGSGPKPEAIDKGIAETKRAVDAIRAHGGEVVFVRAPSAGLYYESEQAGIPRAKTWDRLLRETGSFGIHFEDYPDDAGTRGAGVVAPLRGVGNALHPRLRLGAAATASDAGGSPLTSLHEQDVVTEREIPATRLAAIAWLVLALVVAATAAWEWRMRDLGLVAGDLDDSKSSVVGRTPEGRVGRSRWRRHRRRLTDPVRHQPRRLGGNDAAGARCSSRCRA